MHVVTAVSTIQKLDDDLVPDLSANCRTENSQPLGLWLGCGEGVVRVFNKTALRPAHLERPRLRNRVAVQKIATAGSIIPRHVFSCDVVMAGGSKAGRGTKKEEREGSADSHADIIPLQHPVATTIPKSTSGSRRSQGTLAGCGLRWGRRGNRPGLVR